MSKRYAGETCVLAYSGGLDTSVAVAWLRETLGFEIGRASCRERVSIDV